MKNSRLLLIATIPIGFWAFNFVPAEAMCQNFDAVGWYRYTNKEVGQISRKINGRAWDCGNAYSLGRGFESDEFSAAWSTCIHKETCGKNYLPPGSFKSWIYGERKSWIYGSFEDSKSIGSSRLIDLKRFSKEGQLPLYHQCVQQDGSHIEYCWKAINHMQYNWRK